MLHLTWLEWFAYVASVVLALSLTMSSIVKLRWYNLAGAAAFSLYGFLIHAYPVGILNGFIACADVYYLIQIYTTRERLQLVTVPPGSEYLRLFFEEYRSEIAHFFPGFDFRTGEDRISFYVLRNLVPACVFIGRPLSEGVLEVELDFVVPAYRDFKPGEFLFTQNRARFQEMGVQKLVARSHNPKHDAYLLRMGFAPGSAADGSPLFTLELA